MMLNLSMLLGVVPSRVGGGGPPAASYLRPDGTSYFRRSDGTSYFLRP
jgi:hypothetical protein